MATPPITIRVQLVRAFIEDQPSANKAALFFRAEDAPRDDFYDAKEMYLPVPAAQAGDWTLGGFYTITIAKAEARQ